MPDLNTLSLDALFDTLTREGHTRRLVELARDEDLGRAGGAGAGAGGGGGGGGVSLGDITSRVTIDERALGQARLVARQAGVVCGLRLIPLIADVFAATSHWTVDLHAADGRRVGADATLAVLRGRVRDLLAVERTLLNFIGRLSGIATRTSEFVGLAQGTRARVLDTRKTTPGLRALEKYAVRCGGGSSHRMGLFDAVLIKDNHLAHVPLDRLAAAVSDASARARSLAVERHVDLLFIECEVDRLEQLQTLLEAGGCGVDIVLLDNMPLEHMRQAVRMRDDSGADIELEASGGVTERTIRDIAQTGIDRISVGGLTHQAVSLDVALDIDEPAGRTRNAVTGRP